jgi:hypothetical protein
MAEKQSVLEKESKPVSSYKAYPKVMAFNKGTIKNDVMFGEELQPVALIKFDYLAPFRNFIKKTC